MLFYTSRILQVTFLFALFLTIRIGSTAQGLDNVCNSRVMFYNVENLFDTINNPGVRDGEFTPGGSKRWNSDRYYTKLEKIYKVIACEAGWSFPALIGLCEIENSNVLKGLIYSTPLKKFNYLYVHNDSPDERGIDVALLYQKSQFQLKTYKSIEIALPRNDKTRDILCVQGTLGDMPLTIFINHWPSRYGGKEKTKPKRMIAAKTLVSSIQKHCDTVSHTNIMLMGDFNDTPENESLKLVLNKSFQSKGGNSFSFLNLMPAGEGTITHKEIQFNWYAFDQIIISDQLLKSNDFQVANSELTIIKKQWMLNQYNRPKRTYLGDFYQGGYSDHLPVMMELMCN